MSDGFFFTALIHGAALFEFQLPLAHSHPQTAQLKTLVPILDGCSLEDDDALTEKWAALLASAAAGDKLHPTFARTLQDLTPEEARVLDALYDLAAPRERTPVAARDVENAVDISYDQLALSFENLFRLQLCQPHANYPGAGLEHWIVGMTVFGGTFVLACRGPSSAGAAASDDPSFS